MSTPSARRRRAGLAIAVLVTSAVANLWLGSILLAPPPGVGVAGADERPVPAAVRSLRQADGKEALPTVRVLPGSCEAHLLSARARLHDVADASSQRVPFFASFEAAKPVETPHVVEEAVSRIFSAKDLAEVPHELDCRGALCRLRVFEPEDLDIGNWVEPLQTDRLRRRFHIAAASQPLPVEDSVPRTWLIRTDVYLELDFESLPAVEFLEGIFASFDTPSAVTACRTFGARRGNVELQMTLAHNPRAVAVEADRDLWNDPIARCLVERLSVHAGRFPVLFGNAAAEISETIEVK